MQIYIEGQHTDIQPALRDWITERFEELNTPHDDILHARIVLAKATHHIQGADEARVILSLAGKTLNASKTAETLDDAVKAVLDAIVREVQDYRTQRRGVVKEPGPRPRGRIVRLFVDRGYGFIETDARREVYFHAHAVHGIPFEKLAVGMVVDLDIETGHKGPQAARVIPH
jgi:ribosomal subunit interface protein